MRGISTLSALGLCAEAGDLRRFDRPASLVAYFGIVPSEHSSGPQPPARADHQGGLRLTLAASWSRPPTTIATGPPSGRLSSDARRASTHVLRRSAGAPSAACTSSGSGCAVQRGKPANVVRVALARELGCFVWEVGQLR